MIGRARVRLVPIIQPEGTDGFGPESMKAFEEKVKELQKEGIVTRAVVSPVYPVLADLPDSS